MYVYQHPTNYSIPDMYKWNKLNLFILNIRARLLTVRTLKMGPDLFLYWSLSYMYSH